jgi:DNA (cytosine-5)-methyltransferase 1
VFFDNVHGFTVGFSNDNKKDVPYSDKIVKSLKQLGYNVLWKLIDVSLYGVPQKRTRFILVGALEKDPNSFFDALERNRLDFLESKGLKEKVTVQQAIDDLRKAHGEMMCQDSKRFKSGIYGNANSSYQRFMREGISNDVKSPNSHRFAKHRKDTETLFERLMQLFNEPKRVSPKQNVVEGLKKRGITPLKPNFPCNTITSIPDDYVHYNEPRILTVREMARIQSFPDCFEFRGKYTTGGKLRRVDVPRYTQVANAIPPLFAEQIGHALKELL